MFISACLCFTGNPSFTSVALSCFQSWLADAFWYAAFNCSRSRSASGPTEVMYSKVRITSPPNNSGLLL
tara:strand:- start:79661 stop:79867 length:207 start_codon:yes stop_codon:yes gene_type:complete